MSAAEHVPSPAGLAEATPADSSRAPSPYLVRYAVTGADGHGGRRRRTGPELLIASIITGAISLLDALAYQWVVRTYLTFEPGQPVGDVQGWGALLFGLPGFIFFGAVGICFCTTAAGALILTLVEDARRPALIVPVALLLASIILLAQPFF